MKLITRNTDYAIRAIVFMARHDKDLVSAAELTKKLRIPRPFLRKILQILNKKGLVKSYKGIGGGFTLKVPPDRILLTKLVTIFQGPIELNECLFKKDICPNVKTCALKKKLDRIERHMISELNAITVGDLIKK